MKYTPLLLCLLLAGCSLAPDYHRPNLAMPADWNGATQTGDALDKDWWTHFNSVELTTLIKEAKAQNTDLKAGLHRIEQARAQVKIAHASLLPAVSANADLSFSDSHGIGSNKTYGVGAEAAYEVDLFKRNANTVDAAKNTLNATRFDQAALNLVVTGDTAQHYFSILALQEQLRLTEETIAIYRDTLNIINARYKEGAASGLDVSRQKVELANAEAAIAGLQQQITVEKDALAILVGKAPQQSNENLTILLQQVAIPAITPLQPADLLQRRPDIAALEEGLKAANADIGVARAAIFPSLSITASVNTLDNPTFSAVNLATGVVNSLAVSIFDGGALRAAVTQATERQKELVESYHSAVLVAFQETEDALAAVDATQKREDKYQTALDESRNAYHIAHDRYLGGADDFLTLLDAQRDLLTAEQNHVQARLDRLTAALSLYRALGGGWSLAQS